MNRELLFFFKEQFFSCLLKFFSYSVSSNKISAQRRKSVSVKPLTMNGSKQKMETDNIQAISAKRSLYSLANQKETALSLALVFRHFLSRWLDRILNFKTISFCQNC